MKDFNVAKYLREHNLGSFGILNHYIDIDALKEEETDLGQQEAIPEPYEGDGHPIDGLGGELDRNMDVSMNEADDMENAWMEEVDGIKVGDWTCQFEFPGVLVWSYKNFTIDELGVYATPNFEGDDTTPIQVEDDGENVANMSLPQGEFADFNEYANAMKPMLDRIAKEYVGLEEDKLDEQASDDIEALIAEYSAWLEKNGLPEMSADDLLYDDSIEKTEEQKKYLQSFIERWDNASRNESDGEQAGYDRMMGMVDNTLESQLSKIKMAIDRAREKGLRDMAIFNMLKTNSLTGQTVQSLVDDGFEAQDIVDFFATDFSMDKQDYTSSEEFDYMNDDELDSAGFDNK